MDFGFNEKRARVVATARPVDEIERTGHPARHGRQQRLGHVWPASRGGYR